MINFLKKPKDLSSEVPEIKKYEKKILKKIKNLTMTSFERQFSLIKSVEYIIQNKIQGDVVECGVWRGGNMVLVAEIMKKMKTFRKLWLYDTFEGMTKPSSYDRSFRSGRAIKKFFEKKIGSNSSDWCFASIEEVKKNLKKTKYPTKLLKFIKGPVEETLVQHKPKKISILRLDTDWYSSTKKELEILYPKLVKNGVIIIDDYGHWEGCRKACDEYFKNKKILLHRIDYTCRIGIKT